MKNVKYTMKNYFRFFVCLAFLFLVWILLSTENCELRTAQADTGAPKSTGLTSIPDLEKLGNKELRQVLEQVLAEHARAIDTIHRLLLNDIDTINRDEIPGLQTQIDGIEVGSDDFDIPLLHDVTFTWVGSPSFLVHWTSGYLDYGGDTYTVNEGNSAAHETNRIIIWVDVSDLSDPVTLESDASAGNLTVTKDMWILCIRRAGYSEAIPTLQAPVFHGGLIQANTITASQLAANSVQAAHITAGAINSDGIATGALIVNDAAASLLAQMFSTTTTRTNIENWIYAGDTTLIDGGDIYTTNLFAKDIVVTDPGEIHSAGKDTYGDTTEGFWIGLDQADGDKAKFDIGNGTNYLRWDGTDIWINGKKGILTDGDGNTFDITDGYFQVANAGQTLFTYIQGGQVRFFTAAAGGGTALTYLTPYGLSVKPPTGGAAYVDIANYSGTTCFSATQTDAGQCEVFVGESAGSRIKIQDATSINDVYKFRLIDCYVAEDGDTTINTEGALRYNDTTDKLQVRTAAGWEDCN